MRHVRRTVGIAVLVAVLALPTAALAKGGGGKGKGRPDSPATADSDRPHGKPPWARSSDEGTVGITDPGIPTARAQQVLAEKILSGRFKAHVLQVFYRILLMKQEKHGAAVPLPPPPPTDTATAATG